MILANLPPVVPPPRLLPLQHLLPLTQPIKTLSLLNRAQQISDSIGVISSNDALRDISTSSLRTLFLPSLAAELHTAVRTGANHIARKQRLHQSQVYAAKFLNRTLALGVVPPTTKQLVTWTWTSVPHGELVDVGLDANLLQGEGGSAPHAREVKIAVFKLERALKSNLEAFREAYVAKRKLREVRAPSDVFYDLLLYPQGDARSGGGDEEDEEEDNDDEDAAGATGDNETSSTSAPGGIASVRQYLLALLNLHVLRNAQGIASAAQELQLLRSMPPPPPPNSSTTSGDASNNDASTSEWRLDRGPSTLPTTGPLMAPSGKVLRPFTITSSTSKSRSEVASEVFRPAIDCLRCPSTNIWKKKNVAVTSSKVEAKLRMINQQVPKRGRGEWRKMEPRCAGSGRRTETEGYRLG